MIFLARMPHETGEENFSLGMTGCNCCSDVLCVQALCSGLGVCHMPCISSFWSFGSACREAVHGTLMVVFHGSHIALGCQFLIFVFRSSCLWIHSILWL
jgi:hypothetical protein